MEGKIEHKDRQYYMDECYRLRSELKKCREQLALTKKIPLDTQEAFKNLQNHLKEKQQTINKLKTKLCVLKQNKPTSKQKETINKLREENLKLSIDNKSLRKNISTIIDTTKLKLENETLQTCLQTLTTKNKAVFKNYYDKAILQPDDIQISIGTVILDFEYTFIFQKLFEMHLFDFIVDKQDPDNKTIEDTRNLISICKTFSTSLIKNQIYKPTMNVKEVKDSIRKFVKPYIEIR